MKKSLIEKYTVALETVGVDPDLAKQAAVVIANDNHGLPRTERGQRVVNRAYRQANENDDFS